MSPEDRWTDPAFTARAHAWIDERLVDLGRPRTGTIDQPHLRTWGTVMRVPTAAGSVWFKAPERTLQHEAAVHAVVSARRPDRVPPLLAADSEGAAEGWMLSGDAGRRLREVIAEERSLERWHDVLGACAEIQLACVADVPALLAAGAPHRPLDRLGDDYAAFAARVELDARFTDTAATVGEMASRLASYGIAESVQHDDLHDAQVFVPTVGAPHVILDWGDAVVTHPFFTLAVTLLGTIAYGVDDVTGSVDTAPFRDSYLAPYADAHGTTVAELREAADLAARLGWASRAVHLHDDVDVDVAKTEQRLRLFAEGRA